MSGTRRRDRAEDAAAAPRTVVRHAPGKLFVAGEYAVVEPGTPAILVAVDRYITVTVSAPGGRTDPGPGAAPATGPDRGTVPGTGAGDGRGPGPDVVISSDLGPRRTGWRRHEGRLVALGSDGEAGGGRQTPRASAHVVAAVEVVTRLLAERGLPVPALDIRVTSTLHENGRKFGLGSSGAVTVATVAAVASYCGLAPSADTTYRLAMLATAALDPKGSGGDLAASAFGGWLLYRAPDRDFVLDLARRVGVDRALAAPWPGHEVRRLPAPAGLTLQVGWTGEPASTETMVSGLHRRTWRGSDSHRGFVRASTDLVHACAAALEAGDRQGLLDQIGRARRELARLDDEVGLGVFTPRLTSLCEAAEAVGGAAKPSGAGGGDCGIALLDAAASRDIEEVRRRWAAAGVLPLPVRPALEGIEE